jgi:hypothetical protein
VFQDLRSVLQDLIPEAILSQKYHVHMGPIGNDCGAVSIYSKLNEVEEKEVRYLLIESCC